MHTEHFLKLVEVLIIALQKPKYRPTSSKEHKTLAKLIKSFLCLTGGMYRIDLLFNFLLQQPFGDQFRGFWQELIIAASCSRVKLKLLQEETKSIHKALEP